MAINDDDDFDEAKANGLDSPSNIQAGKKIATKVKNNLFCCTSKDGNSKIGSSHRNWKKDFHPKLQKTRLTRIILSKHGQFFARNYREPGSFLC